MTSVAIIIPWRDRGDARRQAALRRVLVHLRGFPAPVYLASDGRPHDAPFGRQHAYNRGISEHPADVWIFHEADMLVPHARLAEAIALAIEEPGQVVPFSERRDLGPDDSIAVAAGANPEDYEPQRIHKRSHGAVNVVSAETMRAVGQWDELLTSHGYDDTAMREAFQVATGNPVRFIEGPSFHLWHPVGYSPWDGDRREDFPAAEVAATERNRERYRLYKAARTAEEVRRLTAGVR